MGKGIHGMLPLPTGATVVLEAVEITTKVRTNNPVTNAAQ